MPDEQLHPKASIYAVPAPQQVTVNITAVTGNEVVLQFDTPKGNLPGDYDNIVYIWQSSNQVPWSSVPLAAQPVTVNTSSGTAVLGDLDVLNLSYIVGYAVGPDAQTSWTQYPNVVATAFLPVLGDTSSYDDTTQIGEIFRPIVEVATHSATSLVAGISLPSGFNPGASGTYVGIWEGETASYTETPKWWQPAASSETNSRVPFCNIQLRPGATYTLALFATGYAESIEQLKQTAMAATYTFQV